MPTDRTEESFARSDSKDDRSVDRQQGDASQEDLMKKLSEHAKRAVEFSGEELKQLVAVPSPNGGFRMELKVLRAKKPKM